MWRFWTARIDGDRGSKDAEWAIYTYIACSCVLYWRWDWEIKVLVLVTSLHYDQPAGTDTSRSVSVPKHWRWRFNWLASKQRIGRGSQPIEEDNLSDYGLWGSVWAWRYRPVPLTIKAPALMSQNLCPAIHEQSMLSLMMRTWNDVQAESLCNYSINGVIEHG
jgi:hypothetical protein